MSEEVSAEIRVAVDITCAGALIAAIVNLMSISLNFVNNFETNTVLSQSLVASTVINDLIAQDSVTSATLYKAAENLKDELAIIYLPDRSLTYTGEENYNFDYLLNSPSKYYKISVVRNNGEYTITAEEVE